MSDLTPTPPTPTAAAASDAAPDARDAPHAAGAAVNDRPQPFRYTAQLADDIEMRWQRYWDEHDTFRTPNPGEAGFDGSREKFYVLDMFPYPSGAGLHVGHPEGYTATDIIGRYMRHRGRNVLHPMGWDAFGLPAEQYAIQTGIHPAETTKTAIGTFRRQLKRFGFGYDWSREIATIDPRYYKWTQWIWLRAYDAWYDVREDRARTIPELIDDLEAGALRVGEDDAPVTEGGRAWRDLTPEQQRRFIDNQRLAYRSEQTVNWCPKLGTALANEEVIDGRSERGEFPVYRKPLKQWMFRITAYADRLLRDLDCVEWPESTKTMQAEWIGRSEGALVDFPLIASPSSYAPRPPQAHAVHGAGSPTDPARPVPAPPATLRVYTTRPDTIFGATFMVIAPEHPLLEAVLDTPLPETDVRALRDYVERARNRADVDRVAETKDKTGVFTGAYATNPATGEPIPVWTADYVLMTYGTGAIMAVPGQDQRDWDFARAFDLPIVRTVQPPDDLGDEPYMGDGPAINSANDEVSLDGLHIADAKQRIIEWIETRGFGRRKVNYRLRDWLFSRQRYWGEPFPIVYDEQGNHYPVALENLPVELPPLVDYQPIESDEPMPLLAKATDWVKTTAGEAGVDSSVLPPDTPVTRETNTMPGWAGSCWYYLRYCDPNNDERFVSREAEHYWLGAPDSLEAHGVHAAGPHAQNPSTKQGVDLYIGGAEHAVLHLLYARFWHKILYDLGEVSTPEPFAKLFHQGLITSFAYQRADKSLVPIDEVEEREEGVYVERATGERVAQVTAKMSKSLKNVVNPDDVIAEFGADTFRLYEMYMGPLEATKPWNTRDMVGLFRFLQRAWRLIVNEDTGETTLREDRSDDTERALHCTVAKVGEDIERLAFNTAIAALIEFVNTATSGGGLTRDQAERFAIALAPFAPHLAEEMWAKLGRAPAIADAPWPEVDASMLVADEIELPVQILGKVRGRITVPADADQETVERLALNDEKIAPQLEGKAVQKVIVVPGKIINIIAR